MNKSNMVFEKEMSKARMYKRNDIIFSVLLVISACLVYFSKVIGALWALLVLIGHIYFFYKIKNFRCPNCKKYYFRKFYFKSSSEPSINPFVNKCLHCGLKLKKT